MQPRSSNTQAWKAGKDPNFRTLIRLGRDVHEVFGGPPASAIFVSYPEKLAERPAVFKEALRMLKASADYTKSHKDEVYAAVAKATGTETALFESSMAPMRRFRWRCPTPMWHR